LGNNHSHPLKYLTAIACLLFTLGSAVAQLQLTGKYEDPLSSDTEYRQVVTCGTKGIFIYQPFLRDGDLQIAFTMLDTALHPKLDGGVSFGNDKSLQMVRYAGNRVWFLTRQTDRSIDFSLYGIFTDTAIYTYTRFVNAIPLQPLFFEVSGSGAVIAGYYNSRPVALFCNLRTGESKLLPGFFNLPGEINQVIPRADGGFDILLALKNSGYRKSMYVNRYSAEGTLEKTIIVASGRERSLMFGRMSTTGKDSLLIAGIYGNRSESSKGIFTAAVNADDTYTLRFYNYGDLKNYFGYLRRTRQERIRERIERRKAKGRQLRFPSRMLIHDLRPEGKEFLLLGEAFYPTYRSGSNAVSRPGSLGVFTYFRPFYPYQRDMAFDGFRYTHGIVIGVTPQGTIAWDNSISLRNLRSFNLVRFTHYIPGTENGYLLYATEDDYTGTIIRKNEVTGTTGKEVRSSRWDNRIPTADGYRSRILEWYGEMMIQWGVRENKVEVSPGTTANQLVFYLHKLRAQ